MGTTALDDGISHISFILRDSWCPRGSPSSCTEQTPPKCPLDTELPAANKGPLKKKRSNAPFDKHRELLQAQGRQKKKQNKKNGYVPAKKGGGVSRIRAGPEICESLEETERSEVFQMTRWRKRGPPPLTQRKMTQTSMRRNKRQSGGEPSWQQVSLLRAIIVSPSSGGTPMARFG